MPYCNEGCSKCCLTLSGINIDLLYQPDIMQDIREVIEIEKSTKSTYAVYYTDNDLIKKQAQMVVQQKKLEEQRDQAEERADTAEKKVGDLSEILLTINDTKIDLLEKIQIILRGKGFNVSIDTRNGILRLPEGALFSSGSYKLSSQGKVNMDLLREALEEVVVCYAKSENAAAQKLKENCH